MKEIFTANAKEQQAEVGAALEHHRRTGETVVIYARDSGGRLTIGGEHPKMILPTSDIDYSIFDFSEPNGANASWV